MSVFAVVKLLLEINSYTFGCIHLGTKLLWNCLCVLWKSWLYFHLTCFLFVS